MVVFILFFKFPPTLSSKDRGCFSPDSQDAGIANNFWNQLLFLAITDPKSDQ